MGLIDMIKSLSTILSSAFNKSLQHQEKNSQAEKFMGTPRIKPGAAGCKARTLSIMVCGPSTSFHTLYLDEKLGANSDIFSPETVLMTHFKA